MRSSRTGLCLGSILLVAQAVPARASFHIMQTEQVIGGVNGDVTAQAIQFRQRTAFQNQMQFSRYVVRNASGGSPIILAAPASPVPNFNTGDRVLFATPSFAAYTSPAVVPDFTMSAVPASYLAAGTLTFEDNTFGTVYWRLSWGGASYTGPGTGDLTNDADGNFHPPFGGPLPSSTLQALRFNGSATAPSTNNAADYSITPGAAVFVNNAGTSFTVIPAPPTQLSIDQILAPPTIGLPFNVVVRSRNTFGGLANVAANTTFDLSATGGATDVLGGTVAGQINAGTDTATVVGVTYPVAEFIRITAARTSGDVLAAGESDPFPVIPVCDIRGDLNGDALLDGEDIQSAVQCYVADTPLTDECGCADTNATGTFTSADAAGLVNALLGV